MSDIERMVENFEENGFDCSPEPHQRVYCCGEERVPKYVIPFDELDEDHPGYDEYPMFVCPSCGDG